MTQAPWVQSAGQVLNQGAEEAFADGGGGAFGDSAEDQIGVDQAAAKVWFGRLHEATPHSYT